MQEGKLPVQKTAHYCISGKGKHLLVVLHGYGQLARYFIKKFKALEDSYCLLAPEGLHYFYKKGFDGRVGASWMTKENRLDEILDYLNYLEDLLDHILEENTYESISILGFSQGTATASRWFMHSKHSIHKLVLWSGFIAPELDLTTFNQKLHQPLIMAQGIEDNLRPKELYKNTISQYTQAGLIFQELWYEGEHDITEDGLKAVFS